MLKSYDAKTNGRVCDARAVAHLTGHWHRNHCPLSPLRVPNQCGEQLLAGEVRPSSDETFLFITLTEREKVVSPVTSPLSDSLLGLPGCRSWSRESGVTGLVIPDFFLPDPEFHPIPCYTSDSSKLVSSASLLTTGQQLYFIHKPKPKHDLYFHSTLAETMAHCHCGLFL